MSEMWRALVMVDNKIPPSMLQRMRCLPRDLMNGGDIECGMLLKQVTCRYHATQWYLHIKTTIPK